MTAEALAPIYLNHVVQVLDQDAYDAVAESAFMREQFAAFEQKTVSPEPGQSWTGTYLTGVSTYLELFAPGGVEDASAGMGSLAFGVERPGAIASVHERLRAALPGVPDPSLAHWTDGERKVPWFHSVEMPSAGPEEPFGAWVMEYDPAYFEVRRYRLPESGLLLRQAYLHERVAAQSPRLMKEIVGVTLALGDDLGRRVGAMLCAFGYAERRRHDAVLYEGPELTVCVTGARQQSPYQIAALTFSLRRTVGQPVVLRLGATSEVSVRGDLAEWRFGM